MPARYVAGIGGHSTRVGAAQDLAELDIDLAAITQLLALGAALHGTERDQTRREHIAEIQTPGATLKKHQHQLRPISTVVIVQLGRIAWFARADPFELAA